jgi:hypothetical protein
VSDRAIVDGVENSPEDSTAKAPRSAGPKAWLIAACRFVAGAPLTYAWLVVLLYTTYLQHVLTRRQLHAVLIHRSTNLHHLATDPLYVLFSSLFWIDGRYWLPYLFLFTVFLAPAERWLGHLRWVAAGLTCQICATYISEGLLYVQIEYHSAPERLVNARDIGVSYFLVGIAALLAYRIAMPWRWIYLGGLIALFVGAWAIHPGFTAIGHLAAIGIGLCFYPMARARGGTLWSPALLWARLRRPAAQPGEAPAT